MTLGPSPTRFSHRGLGIALACWGGAATAFAAFALAMAWLQELVVRSFPTPTDFRAAVHAMWTVWRIHTPIWIVGGIGLVVCGIRLRALRKGSVALARLACVLALVATSAYMFDLWVRCIPAMEPLFAMHPFMPAGSFRPLMAVSAISSEATIATPIGVLLWGLRSRTRE